MKIVFTKIFIISLFFTTSFVVADNRPYVLSTTAMIGDLVKQLLPNAISAQTLIGSGVDPHLFKPSRSDIAKLISSELIFYNGNFLEGRMGDAIRKLELQGKLVVPVTEKVSKDLLIESGDFQGNYDPHLWMSPVIWSKVSHVIADTLKEKYPDHSEEIEKNRLALQKKLSELDQYIRNIIQTVPEEARILVTAHDAFSYFGKTYELQVLGIQGISTDSEASVKTIEDIVNTLVERKIQAVFVESTVSKKNIKALLEGANARGHTVKVGGELFSDAMGLEGTYLGTYIGMIDHNATTIVNALGGRAPAKGMNSMLSGN